MPILDSSSQLATVVELLQRRAIERANQAAFAFVPGEDDPHAGADVIWTYQDLDRRARVAAAAIRQRAEPGDRAVLLFPPGLEFLAAFFGCLYAGVLPAPSSYPKPRRTSARLDAIVADCSPRLALTTSDALETMPISDQSAAVQQLDWLAIGAGDEPYPLEHVASPQADDPAFLQYTSGSTSQPRGVIVTHANLLHNLELIRTGFGLPSAENEPAPLAAVFWLPAFHDMGLIGGILSPLFAGGTAYLLAPATFLQRPSTWLQIISRTRAQVSGAPNFAYELCVRKVAHEERAKLDLSSWRLAFCGAEPIDAAVLDAFAEAFAPARFAPESFYPCYGLAESTLMVTGGAGPSRPRVLNVNRERLEANELVAAETAAEAQPLVSCGRPLGDQHVVAVNPQTKEIVPEGRVGEIWIRGRSIASGYWNHPEENESTFCARLADGCGPYLRTGDLGSFCDGELYITGRLKDVIIIRGRNLYPQDIERTALRAHVAVGPGAAFSVGGPGSEQLVVVHEIGRAHRSADAAPVLGAIRAAIVDEHEVDPFAIVLLRPLALPLTSSGKVQRRRCRELFVAGELAELARWTQPTDSSPGPADRNGKHVAGAKPAFLGRIAGSTSAELAVDVQAWMLEWLGARVDERADRLSPASSFAEMGIDSLTAVELNLALEQDLGLRLPPAAAWSYPTPATLSQFIAERMLASSAESAASDELADSWFQAMSADAKR